MPSAIGEERKGCASKITRVARKRSARLLSTHCRSWAVRARSPRVLASGETTRASSCVDATSAPNDQTATELRGRVVATCSADSMFAASSTCPQVDPEEKSQPRITEIGVGGGGSLTKSFVHDETELAPSHPSRMSVRRSVVVRIALLLDRVMRP